VAPPVRQNGTNVTAANGASAVVTLPASIAANDVLVVSIYKENTNAVTPPAGWTEKGTAPTTTGPQAQHTFWFRCAGGESGTVTFSWTGSVFRAATCDRFSGCITSGDPIEGINTNTTGAGSATTLNVSLGSTSANTLLYWAGTNFVGGNSWTPPTANGGYTERNDLDVLSNADVQFASGGATGNVTGTAALTGQLTAVLLNLLSAASTVPADPVIPAIPPGMVSPLGLQFQALDLAQQLMIGDWSQPNLTQQATANLSGSGSLTAAEELDPAAALSGSGSLTVSPRFAAAATLSGTGSLTAAPALAGVASLSGAGTLTASPTVTFQGSANLSGSGSLTAAPKILSTASLSGSGTLTALWTLSTLAALSGSGTLSFSQGAGSATLTGTGTLTAAPQFAGTANLSGSGTLTAAETLRIIVGLSGTGTLTAAATLRWIAVLSGTGTLTAAGSQQGAITVARSTATVTAMVLSAATVTDSRDGTPSVTPAATSAAGVTGRDSTSQTVRALTTSSPSVT
jgi:hypothetical protein